jgi:hypothetical protein
VRPAAVKDPSLVIKVRRSMIPWAYSSYQSNASWGIGRVELAGGDGFMGFRIGDCRVK